MIDKNISFIPVNICVVTVSDTRSEENDKSGDLLKQRIIVAGHNLYDRIIIKDDKKEIANLLEKLSSEKKIDVIITTGGTGLTGRDVTPEVVENLFEKKIDGLVKCLGGYLIRK